MGQLMPSNFGPAIRDTTQWPVPGQKIVLQNGNAYILGEQLGNGFFSVVYAGVDLWDNQLAIKVIKPCANESRDYERERGNLISFRHPSITHIYDCFEFRGLHYIVTERCDCTLRSYLTTPYGVPNNWLLPLARSTLQVLAFLHGAKWVHQDVHPGNVFVSFVKNDYGPLPPAPVVKFKLGDLGLSRRAEILTIDSTMAKWMKPPEALDPSFGKLDCRMDIYHAALLFLFICLGREVEFTKEQALDGAPKKAAEGLHSPIGEVIAWGLRRHVINRPQSALGFWQAIKQVVMTPSTANLQPNVHSYE